MPQRISIVYICSLCDTETDDPHKVTAYQIVGPGKPLNFDICTACEEVGPFREVLEKGIRERASKAAPKVPQVLGAEPESGEHACKVCGRSFEAAQGRAAHQRWCGKSPAEVKALKAQIRAARASKK